jgi:biotin carboxyl carrier protein
MTFTYEYNGDTYTVSLERQTDGSYRAVIGERTYTFQARPARDGGWLIVLDGQQVVAYVAAQGDARHVNVDGQTFTLAVPDRRTRRGGAAGGSGDLTAQMPGQVRDLLVSEGDAVERGQTLLILEAMKMEIRVSAPRDGVVQRVHVAKGDVVERGQILLEIGSQG